jgi:hypothetical protein
MLSCLVEVKLFLVEVKLFLIDVELFLVEVELFLVEVELFLIEVEWFGRGCVVPYATLFGIEARIGLTSSSLPHDVIQKYRRKMTY